MKLQLAEILIKASDLGLAVFELQGWGAEGHRDNVRIFHNIINSALVYYVIHKGSERIDSHHFFLKPVSSEIRNHDMVFIAHDEHKIDTAYYRCAASVPGHNRIFENYANFVDYLGNLAKVDSDYGMSIKSVEIPSFVSVGLSYRKIM